MRRRKRFFSAVLTILLILALAAAFYAALRLKHVSDAIQAETAMRAGLHETAFVLPVPDEPDPAAHVCPVDFDALRQSCPDAVGWLSGCGGDVETPVVQGADNEFYLNHLPDGAPNMLGAAFLDCANSALLTDDQSFVFGHHMDVGGGVFAPLLRYQQQAQLTEAPFFILHTPHGCYTAAVFAAFVIPEDEYPYLREFAGADDWVRFVDFLRARSDVQSDVVLTPEDRILTLCTCSSKTDELRYVVCTRLEKL